MPIGGVNGPAQNGPVEAPEDKSFRKVFEAELRELKFSKHAQERLQ